MNFENFSSENNKGNNKEEGTLASYVYSNKKNVNSKRNTRSLYENIEEVVLIFESPFLNTLKCDATTQATQHCI